MGYPIETKICSKNGWSYPSEAKAIWGVNYARNGVTVHWWGGGETADKHDSIVNYFTGQAAAGNKSVNYVVSDGKITKMVEPDNIAWCSGPGNPTTVSIEFQPTLSAEGYKRGGWLISELEKKYGKKLALYPHNKWQQTSCPGTIDINRLRKEADAAGGAEMPIQDSDNEFSRWRKVATQIRGRHQGFTRDEFRAAAVGRTWLQAIEILSDDPEADGYYSDSMLDADNLTNLMGELGITSPVNPNDKEFHLNQLGGRWKRSFYDLINRPDRIRIPDLQKQIADLKAQVAAGGGSIDQGTKDDISFIKTTVQWIKDKLSSVFK